MWLFWFVAFCLMLGWNAFLMQTNAMLRGDLRRARRNEVDRGLLIIRGGRR